MNDLVRDKLTEIINEHSDSICSQPSRLRGLLMDTCNQYRTEIIVLINSLQEGIKDDLLKKHELPYKITREIIVRKLNDNIAMDKDAAGWAVDTWALVLGIDISDTSSTSPQKEIEIPSIEAPSTEQETGQQKSRWKFWGKNKESKPVSTANQTNISQATPIQQIATNAVKVTASQTPSSQQSQANISKATVSQVTPTPQPIPVITPSPTLPQITGKDMVLIPTGDFQMGSNDYDSEKPIHTVYLDAFYIDIYEVTNAQYKKFMDATKYKEPSYWNDSKFNASNHPVVGVSWNDAVAYAKWAGKRLPTEAEWEKSARGGLVGKKYPWGDTLTHDDANYSGTGGKDKWENTSPVGSFAPNRYGLYDMAGNVWEWCADWYDSKYYASSPKSNPKGPGSGKSAVLRGGSWDDYADLDLRVAARFFPSGDLSLVGFRCVQ
jgi:iron(II)-dependent oxidoreductase